MEENSKHTDRPAAESVISGFFMAFLMYSRIPMPRIEWREENLRYALGFFPLVGVVIGGLEYGAWNLMLRAGMNPVLRAAVCALLPLAVTGGIHMDGFMDTVDALSSHAQKNKMLEILKDPHAGAFAVMWCAACMLMYFALWHSLDAAALPLLCEGFVLSRAWSGFLVLGVPPAKADGLDAEFEGAADKRRVRIILLVMIVLVSVLMIAADIPAGAAAAAGAFLCAAAVRRKALRTIGGWTGDIAGFFLVMCELIISAAAVLVSGFL